MDATVLAGALGMGLLYTEGAQKYNTQALVVDEQLGRRASASLSSSHARRRQGQGQGQDAKTSYHGSDNA